MERNELLSCLNDWLAADGKLGNIARALASANVPDAAERIAKLRAELASNIEHVQGDLYQVLEENRAA